MLSSSAPPPWERRDRVLIVVLSAAAAGLRFWKLWLPTEPLFDEIYFVGEGLAYLRGEPFINTHPPLVPLLIAVSVRIFGPSPWSWRFPEAALGGALIPITYLLARRMFHSRFAAVLAAVFVASDGMFIVHSRAALTDIVCLTFGALACLMLFRFIQIPVSQSRRTSLLLCGISMGLGLASKFLLPAVTFLLVISFLLLALISNKRESQIIDAAPQIGTRQIAGGLMLVTSVSAMTYLAVFIPHFVAGWWRGIGSLFHYFNEVIAMQEHMAAIQDPYTSPWWSWPLMLRTFNYRREVFSDGRVAVIWGGGNPILWWGASIAIVLALVRMVHRPKLADCFLVCGYVSHWALLMLSRRQLYLHLFMPSIYFGFMALADLIAKLWRGEARLWEGPWLLAPLAVAMLLGLGLEAGTVCLAALAIGYVTLRGTRSSGKWMCVSFVSAALVTGVYFSPLWLDLALTRSAHDARVWFGGPGLADWVAGQHQE